MIGTMLTIAILGYYINSCYSKISSYANCRI
jgi:hypothetical protein